MVHVTCESYIHTEDGQSRANNFSDSKDFITILKSRVLREKDFLQRVGIYDKIPKIPDGSVRLTPCSPVTTSLSVQQERVLVSSFVKVIYP